MGFIKKHVRLSILIFTILGLIILCLSPYLFVLANKILNRTFSSHTIVIGDYITYISATFTGAIAIAISIIALIISVKSERREQNILKLKIKTSKKILRDYIAACCNDFYAVWKNQKSSVTIDTTSDIDQHIEVLKINEILTDDDSEICFDMLSFVKQAYDKSRSESDAELSGRFCQKYLDLNSPTYLQSKSVIELLKKIN